METLTLTSKTYAFLYLNNIVLNPQAETKVSTTGLSTSNYIQLAEYIRRGMIDVGAPSISEFTVFKDIVNRMSVIETDIN